MDKPTQDPTATPTASAASTSSPPPTATHTSSGPSGSTSAEPSIGATETFFAGLRARAEEARDGLEAMQRQLDSLATTLQVLEHASRGLRGAVTLILDELEAHDRRQRP